MRNISDKFAGKIKQLFPKKMSVRQCRKIWYSQAGHRWQYNTAHALYMLDT